MSHCSPSGYQSHELQTVKPLSPLSALSVTRCSTNSHLRLSNVLFHSIVLEEANCFGFLTAQYARKCPYKCSTRNLFRSPNKGPSVLFLYQGLQQFKDLQWNVTLPLKSSWLRSTRGVLVGVLWNSLYLSHPRLGNNARGPDLNQCIWSMDTRWMFTIICMFWYWVKPEHFAETYTDM